MLQFEKSHLEVGRSLLLDLVGQGVDLEPVQARDKLVGWPLWPARKTIVKYKYQLSIKWQKLPVLRVHHEEHVREAGTKVGAISVVVSGQSSHKLIFSPSKSPGGLGCVDIHALWTVELDHRLTRDIREPDGHHWLHNWD